jgi:hypothetical protein
MIKCLNKALDSGSTDTVFQDAMCGSNVKNPFFLISEIATHLVTRHNTLIHNILSTAPQLSISQNALGTLPEDGNVMPKHVVATIHN